MPIQLKVDGGSIEFGEAFRLYAGGQDFMRIAKSEHTGESLTFWTLEAATFWLGIVDERIKGEANRRGWKELKDSLVVKSIEELDVPTPDSEPKSVGTGFILVEGV